MQHYGTIEKTDAKIQRLGEIASGAKAVECSTKTKNAKAVVKAANGKKAKKSKKSTA